MPFTLVQAHATAMILSMMTFGSIGIFMTRYGRVLRIGTRRQLLGKAVWFQTHRFLLSITSLLVLLGFLLILVRAGGQWVNPNVRGIKLFIHSIFGGIIVCSVVVQIWLALYRCNPNSRYRFIFDWSHRGIGLFAFILAMPTLLLAASSLSNNTAALITIVSLWIFWVIIVVVIGEKVDRKKRTSVLTAANNTNQTDASPDRVNVNLQPDIEAGTQINIGSRYQYHIKLFLLLIHTVICTVLSALLIAFICK